MTRVPLSEFGDSCAVYQIEAEARLIFLVNGAPTETFVDNVPCRVLGGFVEFELLHGEPPEMNESPRPRASRADRMLPRYTALREIHFFFGTAGCGDEQRPREWRNFLARRSAPNSPVGIKRAARPVRINPMRRSLGRLIGTLLICMTDFPPRETQLAAVDDCWFSCSGRAC